MSPLEPGAEAPNFDLTSTEDVVLMLRDEVPRSAVVLYFFAGDDEGSRRDLLALSRRLAGWRELTAAVLAVSPAKLDELKALQADLKLGFPLLTDDRNFARLYGVAAAAEGEAAPPALFVVDRRQKILWAENPVASVEAALPEVERRLKRLPSPAANYPGKATNWLVDRWVNQKTGLRKKRA